MNEQERFAKTKQSYKNMLSRCKPEHKDSKYYFDRGIDVCQRWKKSFSNFLEDMLLCEEGTTLDRIDGTKGYYKENCRWAPKHIQQWNRDYGPYRGVSWAPSANKWRARLSYADREFHLGYFEDKDEAKEAYESHARIIDWLIEAELLR